MKMVMFRTDSGFTLVEVTLALAISGALVVIAFAGQKQARDRSSFSDAVERANTIILDAKNQAFSTVQNGTNGACPPPGQYCNVFLGKVVYFQGSAGDISVYTLTLDSTNVVMATADLTARLPYGVMDTDHSPNQDVCILFTKSIDTAQTAAATKTHCVPTDPLLNPHSILDLSTFVPTQADINFGGIGSLTATLSFNPASMSITKKFQ